jgi:hypothetical protein
LVFCTRPEAIKMVPAVQNIYGYRLEAGRVAGLVADHEAVWRRFEAEDRAFCAWLRDRTEELE